MNFENESQHYPEFLSNYNYNNNPNTYNPNTTNNTYNPNTTNNTYNPNTTNNTYNPNTHNNTILVEKHYVPYNLYCEMFNTNINNTNTINNTRYNLFNSPPNNNQYYNSLYNQQIHPIEIIPHPNISNEGINIRRNLNPNTRYTNQYQYPYLRSYNYANPSLYTFPLHNNINTSGVTGVSGSSTPLPTSNININSILNEFMNTTLPYNFGPIGTGFRSGFARTIVVNDNNHNRNHNQQPSGISLSNINVITNVSRFCDRTINNNNNNHNHNYNHTEVDTCSICQAPFNSTDICRVINNCNHIFHINCIDTWLHDHTTCPFCRYNLLNSVIPTDNVDINDDINIDRNSNRNINSVVSHLYDEEEEEEEENEDYYEDENEEDYIEYNNEEENEDYYENENEENFEENFEEETVNNHTSSTNPNNANNANNTSNPNDEHIFFTTIASNIGISNIDVSNIIDTEPILNDINHFVTMTTPFINSFISNSNSNSSVRFNSNQINSQINRQINNFVNNLNPLLQSFGNFGSYGNRN